MKKKVVKQAYCITCYGHYFDYRCSRTLYQSNSRDDIQNKADVIIRNIICNDKLISKDAWQQRDKMYQQCLLNMQLFNICHIKLVGDYAITICIDIRKAM